MVSGDKVDVYWKVNPPPPLTSPTFFKATGEDMWQ